MKPTVRKVKDIRGRKILGYVATLHTPDSYSDGRISGQQRTTPADAILSCEVEVECALDRLARGTVIGQWNGHTYVVSPSIDGWRTWCDEFS